MPSSLIQNFRKAFFPLFMPIKTRRKHAIVAKITDLKSPAEKANTRIKKKNITTEYDIIKHFTNLGDDKYFFIQKHLILKK